MKHFICVEEHEITYVCGKYRASKGTGLKGTVIIQDAERRTKTGDAAGIFRELAVRHNLEGKRVTLVLGRDIRFLEVKLPKAGDRDVRRMALNELASSGISVTDCAAAVDIRRIPGERQVTAMVYYMESARLDIYMKAMEAAGMLCAEVLPVPGCTAIASYMMCRSRASIVVDVEKESLGLYGVTGGHCLAWKSSALKAGRFLEMGAEELLYEEIAEQAAGIKEHMEEDCGKCSPELIVLLGDCLKDWSRALSYLEEHLELPCTGGILNISMERNAKTGNAESESRISPGTLAAIAAGSSSKSKAVRLKGNKNLDGTGLFKGMTGAISKGYAAFLLINILAVTGISCYIGLLQYQASGELTGLQEIMADPGYRERYQEVQRMGSGMEAEAARRNAEQAVQKDITGYLGMDAFHAFTGAMEPGMAVEAVRYDKDSTTLEMVISMDGPAQVPDYVDRVRESGVFPHVSHSLWEKRENTGTGRVYTSVDAVLKEGGQDETQ